MPACYCKYFGCNGQLVDDKTRKRHERFDFSETYHSDVCRRFEFAQLLRLTLSQRNANRAAVEEVESSKRAAPRNQTQIISIPQSVTEMLQSLVELQHEAELQSKALYNLKSRTLTSSSSASKSLLDETLTHFIKMETTLATLIALGCRGSSVAMRAKEELNFKLRSNIDEIKHLRDILTNASTSGLSVMTHKVISTNKPGEVLDRKDTVQNTDINGRRALCPRFAEFQLVVLAAKLVPSACPGLSWPFAPVLK